MQNQILIIATPNLRASNYEYYVHSHLTYAAMHEHIPDLVESATFITWSSLSSMSSVMFIGILRKATTTIDAIEIVVQDWAPFFLSRQLIVSALRDDLFDRPSLHSEGLKEKTSFKTPNSVSSGIRLALTSTGCPPAFRKKFAWLSGSFDRKVWFGYHAAYITR